MCQQGGAETALAVRSRENLEQAGARQFLPGIWFTSVLEDADSPAAGGYEVGSCPRAEAVAQHLVNLPTHPRVASRDADALAGLVTDVLARMVN